MCYETIYFIRRVSLSLSYSVEVTLAIKEKHTALFAPHTLNLNCNELIANINYKIVAFFGSWPTYSIAEFHQTCFDKHF